MSDTTRRKAATPARLASEQAAREGAPQWAGVQLRTLEQDVLTSLGNEPDRFYWERPSEGTALATAGRVHEITASGPGRFTACAHAARNAFARIHLAGDLDEGALGPILVGGFAFSDAPSSGERWQGFPAARLILPALTLSRGPGGTFRTVLAEVTPGDEAKEVAAKLEAQIERARPGVAPDDLDPTAPSYEAHSDRPLGDYLERVCQALGDIAAGELEKVVIARSVRLRGTARFEPNHLLHALRRRHPSCASFAVGIDDATFLGATPESLLRRTGNRIETAALAGSALRGRTPEADAALARDLLESKKEQAEHAVVVRAIQEALQPHCARLDLPEAPSLLALESIQHLETRITGELEEDRHLLELAADLHPTPAVGGAPREAALDWLADHESLDRGWYAGAVGYVDAQGGGDLAVALRSALLRNDEADLFAGAGIVAGSDPEAELAETRLKLRPLLTQLLEL